MSPALIGYVGARGFKRGLYQAGRFAFGLSQRRGISFRSSLPPAWTLTSWLRLNQLE